MTKTIAIGRRGGRLAIHTEYRATDLPADRIMLALVGEHDEETLLTLTHDEAAELRTALDPQDTGA